MELILELEHLLAAAKNLPKTFSPELCNILSQALQHISRLDGYNLQPYNHNLEELSKTCNIESEYDTTRNSTIEGLAELIARMHELGIRN